MTHANPFLHTILLTQICDASRDVVDVGWMYDVSVCIVGGGRGCWVRGVWREAVVKGCDAGDGGWDGAQEVVDGWFSADRGLERVAPGAAVNVAVVRLVVLGSWNVHDNEVMAGTAEEVHYP
jgi:hypothetical protein